MSEKGELGEWTSAAKHTNVKRSDASCVSNQKNIQRMSSMKEHATPYNVSLKWEKLERVNEQCYDVKFCVHLNKIRMETRWLLWETLYGEG